MKTVWRDGCFRPALMLSALLLALTSPLNVCGQETEEESPSLIQTPRLGTRPLAVLTLAGLEQAREKFEALFEIAGHLETAQGIVSRIDEATDTLAGIHRTKPGGVAVYMESIFPPSFEFVAFVPLSDTDAFMRTLELGPIVASPVTGEDGRYELLGPTQTTQVRIEDGYAFIQLPVMEPDEAFERPLFHPAEELREQSGRYDLSVMLDVESIPPATRRLITGFLTSTMSTQMQQRDDEADGVYEMRRAWMQADIDAVSVLFDECQQITVGISVELEPRVAHLDFVLDVREGSSMLHEILQSTTKPSYFAPILNDDSAVSLSLSQVLAERDRVRYVGVLDGLHQELNRQLGLSTSDSEPDQPSPFGIAITALQDTVQEGHLDLFGQCYTDSESHLVVVAAFRVLDGDAIAVGLKDLADRFQGREELDTLQIGIGEHAGIEFHRIGLGPGDPGRNAILGPDAGVVFGCGPASMWLGLGGDETMDTVTGVMNQLTAAWEQPTQRAHSSGFRVVVNLNQLIELGETAGAASAAADAESQQTASSTERPAQEDSSLTRRQRRRRRFRAARQARLTAWKETLAEGGDRVLIDFQPADHGSRTRIELGEAFLKGIGRAVSVSLQPPKQD